MESLNIVFVTQKQRIPLTGGEISYVATIPECNELPKMSELYKKAEDRCRRFCAEKLPSIVPFSDHQYRYRLSCKAVCTDENITVTLTVTLTDRTSCHTMEKYDVSHVWKDDIIRRKMKSK